MQQLTCSNKFSSFRVISTNLASVNIDLIKMCGLVLTIVYLGISKNITFTNVSNNNGSFDVSIVDLHTCSMECSMHIKVYFGYKLLNPTSLFLLQCLNAIVNIGSQ